jgi:hypothetical protein
MEKLMLKKVTVTLVVAAVTVLSGCASFRNNEVPEAAVATVTNLQKKPTAYVQPRLFRGEPGTNVTEVTSQSEKLQAVAGGALEGSGVFSKVSFAEADKAQSDHTLVVDVYNHGSIGASAISGFISGFTFGVIPGVATDNYTVEIKLLDKAGAEVGKTSSKDSITTWIGIWFIPMMGNTPEKAFSATIDNQIKTAVKRLMEEGKLKLSSDRPFTPRVHSSTLALALSWQ